MKMYSPERLRDFGRCPGNQIIPLTAELGPMLADALELADALARDTIRSNTTAHTMDGGKTTWWDLASWEEEDTEPLDQAVRYLEARGLLEHYPTNSNWVSPRDAE